MHFQMHQLHQKHFSTPLLAFAQLFTLLSLPMKRKRKAQLSDQELRRIQKDQGYFDGRFGSRRISSKKKEASRKKCRKKVDYE